MNSKILITGCQRSGTTLLGLILDSHPSISTIDEDVYFNYSNTSQKPFPSNNVVYKLPTCSANFDFIRKQKFTQVLWVQRNCFDVVASMLRLKFNIGRDKKMSWAERFAQVEIVRCLTHFPQNFLKDSIVGVEHFFHILGTPPQERSPDDIIFLAAFCWKLKLRTLQIYDYYKIPYMIVSYEELTSRPRRMLNDILQKLNLNWNNRLLNHHKYHFGISVGNTKNSRPIDTTGIGAFEQFFNEGQLAMIEKICFKFDFLKKECCM